MLREIEAGCICTVSNYVGDAAHEPEEVLQKGIDDMTLVALETCLTLETDRAQP